MSKSAEKADPADLTYVLFRGTLSGTAGGQQFDVSAWSGFTGGTKVGPGPPEWLRYLAPVLTGVKTGEGKNHTQHGGPLPAGGYTISPPAHHPRLGLSAYLAPDPTNVMMGRGDFFIHGRGKHGSDGCIVPAARFQELMAALKKSAGGRLVVRNF